MKNFLALIGTLLLATGSATASPRLFRIDHNKTVASGYAIAWGIPGKFIDFEKLDQSPDADIVKFIETAEASNYLVDIETNSVLKAMNSDNVDYILGGYHVGNHYTLDIDNVAVEGLCRSCDAVAIVESEKWGNAIKSLEIIERNKGTRIVKSMDDYAFDKLLKTAIRKKITEKEALQLFDNGAPSFAIETGVYDNGTEINRVRVDFSIPKSDDAGLNIEALVKVSMVESKIKVEVLSVLQKIE